MNRSLHETKSAESCYKASMRGNDEQQGAVFSYVSAEQRIAADHPLRRIRAMTDGAAEGIVAGVRPVVCERRSAVDCAREAVGGCCCRGCTRGGAGGL